MLRTEQYARALALESAVRFASGAAGIKRPGVVTTGMTEEEVLDLADKFEDYIMMGRD